MGVSYFILDCCKEIIGDCWGEYTYCETCGAVVCYDCLDDLGYERSEWEEDGELFECPICDQFRHMNDNYGDFI